MVKVYVLISEKRNKKYVGMTADLDMRLREHNAGKTKSTKAYRPWKVAYFEELDSYEAARKREKYLKSAAGRRFIAKKLEEIKP